jgi:Beta/Gamma crystallin
MFQFNKQLTLLALLTVASLGGTILTIANVSAQSKSSGSIKDVTLWSKANLKGSSFESDKGVPDLHQVGFDNKASSIAVNNGQKWRFYKDKDFQGEFVEIGPNQSRGNLGMLNNQVSSFKSVP